MVGIFKVSTLIYERDNGEEKVGRGTECNIQMLLSINKVVC